MSVSLVILALVGKALWLDAAEFYLVICGTNLLILVGLVLIRSLSWGERAFVFIYCFIERAKLQDSVDPIFKE